MSDEWEAITDAAHQVHKDGGRELARLVIAADDLIEELQAEAEGAAAIIATERAEVLRLRERIEELETEVKRLNEQMDVIEEMGTESLNALPDCLMRLAPALVENEELKAERDAAVAAAYEDAAQLLDECSIDGCAFLQTSPEWIGSRDALDRVRREARNEALEEALLMAELYPQPHGSRIANKIRAMMEDDDT